MTPIRLIGIDHVVLRCWALEQTLAFYREVLGCHLERVVEDIGLYQLRAGSCLIDLVPVGSELGGSSPPREAAFNMAHVCLRIEAVEFDALREFLLTRGIDTQAPARRYGADGFGQSIYIQDPEGNIVELKGPPETEATDPAKPA